ncbi:MAG: hypothetical protein ACT4PT_01295 [Methanobacteriota archaeon]
MAVERWMVTAGGVAVLVLIYGLLAIEMIRAIIDGRQLATNPLLTATTGVFVTCTLGHGAHLAHAIFASALFWGVSGEAARASAAAMFGDPRLVWWTAFTVGTAIYFYTLRSRLAIVYRGAALCEDMAKREAQALEMHDNIVQGLSEAKLALDLGRRDEGLAAVERTLAASQKIITALLGEETSEVALGPGDLRRETSAGSPR